MAVVTGASSGIGLATAIELGRLGWSVAMASRRAEALQAGAEAVMRAGAAGVLVLPTDVGDPVQVESMIDGAVERFGRLDALINNAGVAPLAPIDRTDVEMLSRTFFVNAIGPGVAIARAWPIMKAQGGGRIVNVGTLGTRDPFPGFFAYAASKCALDSYARSIAKEGVEFGIRGFTVSPGAVETPTLRALFDETLIPPSAALSADEVASIVVDCATGRCDDANGQVLWVDAPA